MEGAFPFAVVGFAAQNKSRPDPADRTGFIFLGSLSD
jgi:hypothetical protein